MHALTVAPTAELIERYEAKYRIPPDLVAPIREAIQARCVPDEAGENGVYRIVSLYLDDAARTLYYETQDRAPRRYKLRIRRYSSGPVHLEVKRRIKGVISKLRVAVSSVIWPAAFHDPRLLDRLSEKKRKTAYDFVNRCLLLDAQPAALVRYRREAWVSTLDDYARITFDSQIEGRRPDGWHIPFADDPSRWLPVDHASRFGIGQSGVVLELKCTALVPLWISDIVHRFKLFRTSFSKYSSALEAVDPQPAPPTYVQARRLR